MNKFTVTFRNAVGELKTEEMVLDFNEVIPATLWLEHLFALKVIWISKH